MKRRDFLKLCSLPTMASLSFHTKASSSFTPNAMSRSIISYPKQSMGFSTGFNKLDSAIKGLHKGELFVIAGRPAMGKSVLMANMIRRMHEQDQAIIGCLDECIDSNLSRRVDYLLQGTINKKKGVFPHDDMIWQDLISYSRISTSYISNSKEKFIFSKNKTMFTLDEVTGYIDMMVKNDIEVIFVDAIENIYTPRSAIHHDKEKILSTLKRQAKDYGIAVIISTDVNHDVETRVDRMPYPMDLPDWQSYLNHADRFCFLMREHLYDNSFKENELSILTYTKYTNEYYRFNLQFTDYPFELNTA